MLVMCLALISLSGAALGAVSLDDLTGPWQLFIDDHLVASRANVVRTYHPFRKYAGNPVLTATEAWEDSITYIYGTVLPAESGTGLRMWYHTLRPEDTNNDGSNILYAESADGIHWTKPNLGIRSWHGSTANNMIYNRPGGSGITSVLHTPWEPDPGRRYTLLNFDIGGYWGAWSSDGVHTVDVPGNPVLTGGGDVGQFLWDPHTQQFRAYVKLNSYVNGLQRRSLGHCATTDVRTWPPLSLILEPDAFDDRWVPPGTVQRTHIYGMSVFAYESMYLGLLWIFRATDAEGYYIGPVYAEIASSRDGIHWTREEGDRPPILPLGPAGAWDDGQLYTARAPVRVGNTLWIYYGACDDVHGTATKKLNCSIGLATLRKDGFASLDAGSSVGTVVTHPLAGIGGSLHVNYAASGGWVRVEVLDADGRVVPGYGQAECNPLQGDSIDQAVTWVGRDELPAGLPVLSLRFILQNASLYSFMTTSSGQPAFPPAITLHPGPARALPGGTATFRVQAVGSEPLTYRWQRGGVDLTDGGHYTGTATATLTVSPVALEDIGSYRCVVSNPHGTATSDPALLTLLVATFNSVGVLPGGTASTITGMTADGSVVCGSSGGRAFIWSAAAGMRDLGVPAGATSSSAAGVGILNGTVVVAVDTNAATSRARRWDGNVAGVGTFTALPRVGGTREWTVQALGTDGTTELWIAGSTLNGGDGNGREAVRYRQGAGTTVVLPLPTSPAGAHDHSDALGISDTGVAGGRVQYPGTAPTGGARQAWYTTGTTSTMLYTLFGAPSSSVEAVVRCVSRNGLVQGGWSYRPGLGSNLTPAVWINSRTPTAIPLLPGGDNDNAGEVLALSADGAIAGGYSMYSPGGPEEAFLWDAANGTRRLQGLLASQFGVDLSGWMLQRVTAMSADGSVLAGTGVHDGVAEGWVVAFVEILPNPPTIIEQPVSQTVCPGSSVRFTVSAAGEGMLSYRWQKGGLDLVDGGHYSGTATPTLTIARADESDVGSYRCVVTGDGGSTTSEAATLALTPTAPADIDRDCDVDLADFGFFQTCFNGPNRPWVHSGCEAADLDGDLDVDLGDFAAMQMCFNGPNAPPACP